MVTVCPRCKSYIGFNLPPRVEGLKLRCSACATVFRIIRKDAAAPSHASAEDPRRVRVVVANDQPDFCARVAKTLSEDIYGVVYCNDGRLALATIERLKPDVAVVDVSLPGMFGFEVCEAVRSNPELASVRLILLAELRDHRKYTRTPSSLYGADTSVDKLLIEEELESAIRELVPPSRFAAVAAPQRHEEPVSSPPAEAMAAELAEPTVEEAPDEVFPEPLTEEQAKAQRLARLIVSDIALYNRALVEEGVRTGKLFDLLADDIREGRALYERRVPEEVRRTTSFLDEAFSDLVARKKQELSCS